MPRVSFAFFATGCVFLLVGMGMGTWMGATQQFTLSPVHAHLNLIGWATMALMGTFYALVGDRAPRALAWINYILLTLGMVVMAPALGSMLLGQTRFLPALVVSEFLTIGGTVVFFAAVLIAWRRSKRTAGLGAASAAE